MFERCIETDPNTTDTRPCCPSNVNLVYTKHAKSSVRNGIWRFIDSNANFTCPPSSMRKLRYTAAANVDALASVPCVFFSSTTDCPLLAFRRFASCHTDHWSPFVGRSVDRSIWENDVSDTRELNGNKAADAFRTIQWMFMAKGWCNYYCLLAAIWILWVFRRVRNGVSLSFPSREMDFVC